MVYLHHINVYDLTCSFISAVQKTCPGGYEYNPYSNTCFNLVRLEKSWPDAKKHCEDQGEYLATLPTLESSYWLINMLKTHPGKYFNPFLSMKLFTNVFFVFFTI